MMNLVRCVQTIHIDMKSDRRMRRALMIALLVRLCKTLIKVLIKSVVWLVRTTFAYVQLVVAIQLLYVMAPVWGVMTLGGWIVKRIRRNVP